MMVRGPEYADHLTSAERRTLDALVAAQAKRGGSSRASWRAPVGAGLAALAILLAATTITMLGRTTPPPVAPASDGPRPEPIAATLGALATAAAAVAEPVDPPAVWHRHRIDVVVPTATCQVVAVSTETWEDPEQPTERPLSGTLRATPAPSTGLAAVERYQRDPADPWSGCVEVSADPTSFPVFEREGEVAAAWDELADRLATPLPPYADPRILLIDKPSRMPPESVDALLTEVACQDEPDRPVPLDEASAPECDQAPAAGGAELAGRWWATFVQLVTSPLPDAPLRAAALRAAAGRDDLAALPDVVVGETGRPGARLQVPYVVDGTLTTAELLFDRDSGALRERVIHTDSGVQLTAYLPT